MKAFKDVQVQEHVYILQPITFKIWPAEVKTSMIHPKSTNQIVWIIEFYVPFKDKRITTEMLKEADTMPGNTRVTQQIWCPNKNHSMGIFDTAPMPTIIATTNEELEKFLKTATPNDLADYLHLSTHGNTGRK